MAEGDRTAGPALSADRALAVVRIHLDRVHDAVLRAGCTRADAVEVVRATALALVDRGAAAPSSADDAVGRWFADALASGRRLAAEPAPGLPGDAEQQELQSALASLPDDERTAVLLRDGYDLPPTAVAAALGTDVGSVEQTLDRGRRALPVGDALTGLTVLGLPAAARSDVLQQVEDLAHRRLPQARPRPDSARVVTDAGPPEPPVRVLSPLLAGLSVVLAVLTGVGAGLYLAREDGPRPLTGAAAALPSGVAFVTPQPSVTAVPAAPTVAPVQRRPELVVVPPSPLPTPTPSPTPTPTPTPTALPAIALSPAGGTNGTTIAVTGTGFPAGDEVRLDYLDVTGLPTGSSAVAVADDSGALTASLAAQDPSGTPGAHLVIATVGDAAEPATSAVFTAE